MKKKKILRNTGPKQISITYNSINRQSIFLRINFYVCSSFFLESIPQMYPVNMYIYILTLSHVYITYMCTYTYCCTSIS